MSAHTGELLSGTSLYLLNLDSEGFLAEVGTASPWTTRWQCGGRMGWTVGTRGYLVTSAWISAVACSRSLVPQRGEALLVVFVLRVCCLFVVLFHALSFHRFQVSLRDGCGHLSQYLKWTGLLEYERRYVFFAGPLWLAGACCWDLTR